MVYCNNCAKEMGVNIESRIVAMENVGYLYDELRNDLKNIIRNNEESKIESKFKRFLFRHFKITDVNMPIERIPMYNSLDFCNSSCYQEWKGKIKKFVLSENNTHQEKTEIPTNHQSAVHVSSPEKFVDRGEKGSAPDETIQDANSELNEVKKDGL